MAAPPGATADVVGERGSFEVKMISAGAAGAERRVVYECNFSVDADAAGAFLEYLRGHIREIVSLDEGALFDRGTLCVAEAESSAPGDAGRVLLVARYRALSRFRLQEYFDREGERLRQDMLSRFAGKFTVTRRILAIDSLIE